MSDTQPTIHVIDDLIAQRLPAWLLDHAQPQRLDGLRKALHRQEDCNARLSPILQGIPTLHTFGAGLLEEKLRQMGVSNPDVKHAVVCLSERVTLPTAAPALPLPGYVRRTKRSLLAAALHNYHRSETRPGFLRKGELIDRRGNRLPISFPAFAAVCREVDVGGKYQTLLEQHLEPDGKSGHATLRVHALVEQSFKTHFEVAMRMAAFKGDIDERTYLLMLPEVADKPVVPAVTGSVKPRQLYVLGRLVHGVLTLEIRAAINDSLESVILWVPNDPQAPVTCHADWGALNRYLGERFRNPSYRRFFARFITERERVNFYRVLEARVGEAQTAGVELDTRHASLTIAPFQHLRSQFLAKIIDDAKVLAVPTGVEDSEDREARLQGYLELGLDLLNVASFFVPLLGEMLLVANVLQIADEVYEGYQDWRIGDREGSMNHLFNVAENVVLGVMIAGGSKVAMRAVERVAFVDELVPVRNSASQVKLIAAELPGYQAEPRRGVGAQEWLWHVDEKSYRVVQGQHDEASRIHHPGRASAYQPLVEQNGSGGWRHELEAPQLWAGKANLVRRLSAHLAELPEATCEYLLQVTGLTEAQVRRLHVEHAGAPARLLDALELHQVHASHPDFSAARLAQHIARRQTRPNGIERLLQRNFQGLSARCTREVVQQATGAQLDLLSNEQRIPLAVAQRARWLQRESRLDRACAGLRLSGCVNVDTERLALGLLSRRLSLPDDWRIELRDGSSSGRILASIGEGDDVRFIVRRLDGYRYGDQKTSVTYLGALLAALDDTQKIELGDAAVSPVALGYFLAEAAFADRMQAAELCGMARHGAGLRPPSRLGDGRLGYPLSGRGESSRRAIGRGIQQVFPTLTDEELEAYLLDLAARQVGLWEHYSQLTEQLAHLRDSLRQWRRDASNPLEALRRRRVATALRRSWRRKITDLAGDYVLVIEGERVGSLPDLPDGVRYDHVRRLVLSNLGLTEISADFLRRFPNLVELDLSGNQLVAIPQGIDEMPRLRHLNLQDNRIVMDEAGELRLARISALQRLDLSHNPLGRAPVLTRLANLREVNLRSVGLEMFPERISFRAYVDLRDNNIRELRREIERLRLQVRQLSLHDNPLNESAEALLDEARGTSPGRWGSASASHQQVGDDLFETLAGSAVATERDAYMATWTALHQESQSSGLFRFLADFVRSTDYESHPGHFRGRIWRILQGCEQYEQLRERLFLEASGPRSCEDRLLLVLEQLELGVTVERAVEDARGNQIEARLLGLGRGLSRLDEVDRLASLHLRQMRNEQVPLVDDIEVRLFYRQRLARALGLPIEVDDMHYPGFANVNTSDLIRAQNQVLKNETAETLIASLAQRPFWERYVREFYAERFEEILQPLHARFEALQAQVDREEINEQEFIDRCRALRESYERSERALIERLAREAHDRWRGTPP